MNKKTKLIASILSITVLASSILTIASFGGKNIFIKSKADYGSYSVTWDTSSATTFQNKSGSTGFYAYSKSLGGSTFVLDANFAAKNNSEYPYIGDLSNNNEVLLHPSSTNYFQKLESITISKSSVGSLSTMYVAVARDSSKDYVLYEITPTNAGVTLSFDFGPFYIKLIGSSDTTYLQSIKLNFSCDSSKDKEPPVYLLPDLSTSTPSGYIHTVVNGVDTKIPNYVQASISNTLITFGSYSLYPLSSNVLSRNPNHSKTSDYYEGGTIKIIDGAINIISEKVDANNYVYFLEEEEIVASDSLVDNSPWTLSNDLYSFSITFNSSGTGVANCTYSNQFTPKSNSYSFEWYKTKSSGVVYNLIMSNFILLSGSSYNYDVRQFESGTVTYNKDESNVSSIVIKVSYVSYGTTMSKTYTYSA